MLRKVVLALLFPLAALATNGEDCNVDVTQFTKSLGGKVRALGCISVLDDINNGVGGPISYQLGTDTRFAGQPDAVRFLVGTDNDCTAGTVTLTTAWAENGVENNLTAAGTTLDIDSTSPAGTTAITVAVRNNTVAPFLLFRWSGAVCVGGFDILMIPYEIQQ